MHKVFASQNANVSDTVVWLFLSDSLDYIFYAIVLSYYDVIVQR
jgi:hypothetical protein